MIATMSLVDIFRAVNVPAWSLVFCCLLPAAYRLMTRQGRYLDALLGVIFLLSLNRLSFLLRVSPEFSHVSAFVLALSLAWAATWYQRHDR